MGKNANKRKSTIKPPIEKIGKTRIATYGQAMVFSDMYPSSKTEAAKNLFMLENEVSKTLKMPKLEYSTRASLEDFDNVFPWDGTYDELDIGFLFAVVSETTPEYRGWTKQQFYGVTVMSSYCTANHARNHYAAFCNMPGVRSITYSTPRRHMILAEMVDNA
jgi:hypothetical protein